MFSKSSKRNLQLFSFSDRDGKGDDSERNVKRAGIVSRCLDAEDEASMFFEPASCDSDLASIKCLSSCEVLVLDISSIQFS